jgi:hypothetical protein
LLAVLAGKVMFDLLTYFGGPFWYKGIVGAGGMFVASNVLKWFKKKDGKFFATI